MAGCRYDEHLSSGHRIQGRPLLVTSRQARAGVAHGTLWNVISEPAMWRATVLADLAESMKPGPIHLATAVDYRGAVDWIVNPVVTAEINPVALTVAMFVGAPVSTAVLVQGRPTRDLPLNGAGSPPAPSAESATCSRCARRWEGTQRTRWAIHH